MAMKKKPAASRGQKAESARMSKQAERGVGVPAKKSERAATIKKADEVFGKGKYNLISGNRDKVAISNSKKSFDYMGTGKLTAVPKGVGSISKARTKITSSESSSPRIYNPWKKQMVTVVAKTKDAKFQEQTAKTKKKK